MKSRRSKFKNNLKEFIFWDYIQRIELCDDIIKFFKNSKNKQRGTVGRLGGASTIDPSQKDSTDVWFPWNNTQIGSEYNRELHLIFDKYIEIFPMCNNYAPWGMVENSNIQYYKPGQGFKVWHTERTGIHEPVSSRHLVFMTYLNDVTDGGETEFYHQKLKIKPKKGLTVIWPADWTYTHRGIVSPTQEKYIVTGWYNFINPLTSNE
jgi:hypothetical protein